MNSERVATVRPSSRTFFGPEAVLVMVLACGCAQPKRPLPLPAPLDRDEALRRYNENVEAIPAFKARIRHWELQLVNEQTVESHSGSGARVFYRPPVSDDAFPPFYLWADSTPIVGDAALVIGSNAQEYWLYSEPAKRGIWGQHGHEDRSCTPKEPFNPRLLVEMMGLRPIPDDPESAPYPLYKVLAEEYVIEYAETSDNGLRVRREIFFDRQTDLPVRIYVYDDRGLRLLECRLDPKTYQIIGEAHLPGNIELLSDLDGSYLRLRLREFREDFVDRAELFVRPVEVRNVEFTQIDKDCDD